LHHDELSLLCLVYIVDGNHVRVIQAGNIPGLLAEVFDRARISQQHWSQFFQGHQPIQLPVVGTVDNGKATSPNLLQNFVSTQFICHILSPHSNQRLTVQSGADTGRGLS
jgi:hypothetical protein